MRGRPLVAPGHEGADSGWRRVENCDFVASDNFPEAVAAWKIRRAFVHDDGCAIGQRPVDDVAVACDPADVGGAPVNIVIVKIEDEARAPHALEQIASGGVQHTFRLSRGAAGVKNIKRMFGIERRGGAFLRGGRFEVVPPEVTAFLPADFQAGAANHDGFFDGRALLQCRVSGFFQGNDLSAAVASISGDQYF